MILSIWQLMYLFLMGTFLALMEIEIEGKDGWAANLPTFRIKGWWHKIFKKELTGYHIMLLTLVTLFAHLPLVIAKRFSLELEMLVISQLIMFFIYEDFLWFVFNPNYKLKNFKKGYVPWHTSWLSGLPTDYWLGMIASLAIPAIFLGAGQLLFQVYYLITFTIFTLITIALYYTFFKHRL
jgi:hypothetical protein